MLILRVVLLLNLLVFSGSPRAQEPQKQAVLVAGTHISLKVPEGFTPATQFAGYEVETFGASIAVTELSAPFSEASARFSDEAALLKKGITLLSKEEVKVNDFKGLLVKLKQHAYGTEFYKWVVVFGDEKEAVQIAALFPSEFEAELSATLKASILGATWDRKKETTP